MGYSSKIPKANTAVAVYDLRGKEVYKTDTVTQNLYLNLHLPHGVYLLRYTDGDEYCVKRILIED